jgi:hypothetical protein
MGGVNNVLCINQGSHAKSLQSYGADPAYQELMKIGAADPVGNVMEPWLERILYGAPKGIKPVMVHRDHHVERTAVAIAIELAPKLEKRMALIGVEIGIGAPLLKDDYQRGVYRLDQRSAQKWVFEIISVARSCHSIASENAEALLKSLIIYAKPSHFLCGPLDLFHIRRMPNDNILPVWHHAFVLC